MGRVTRILKASTQASTHQQPVRDSNHAEPPRNPAPDAELARVVAAWPHLPQHIRRTILTLISAGAVKPQ
jgi:hypothetical protein